MRNPGTQEKTCILMLIDPDFMSMESRIVHLHTHTLSFSFSRFPGSS